MAETTIAWTRRGAVPGFSFNAWWGCTKVSEGCTACYASEIDARFFPPGLRHWGAVDRKLMSEAYWAKPILWNRKAEESRTQPLVFTNSMADVMDPRPQVQPHRERLWRLIAATPSLMWILLTKLPLNLPRFLPAGWGDGWHNVCLGVSVEARAYVRRIDDLMKVPAQTTVVSFEPLLEDVVPALQERMAEQEFDWMLVGGESGPHGRPMNLSWVRKLHAHAAITGTRFFFKQTGRILLRPDSRRLFTPEDQQGEDPAAWPAEISDLSMRAFPDFPPPKLQQASLF